MKQLSYQSAYRVRRSKVGVVAVLILIGQILLLEAMALESESEAPLPVSGGLINPLEHRVELHDEKTDHRHTEHPVSGEEGKSKAAEAPQIRRLGKHHSTDKSVAGGGVIIGGLVTAIFAAVFCYIRVTRKRDTT